MLRVTEGYSSGKPTYGFGDGGNIRGKGFGEVGDGRRVKAAHGAGGVEGLKPAGGFATAVNTNGVYASQHTRSPPSCPSSDLFYLRNS